jgi:hypothetical protein
MHVTAVNSSSSSYSSPSSHFASIVVQIIMMTRQQLYILIIPRSNLIKPRRITTSRQNRVSTPPIADVIPLYWLHLTWRAPTSRQRKVYPLLTSWNHQGLSVFNGNFLFYLSPLPFAFTQIQHRTDMARRKYMACITWLGERDRRNFLS